MYELGENVIIRIEDSYQVGIVTDFHKKNNKIISYNVRSEKGSEYIHIPVNKFDETYTICSKLTTKAIGSGEISNKMTIESIANYA